MKIREIRAKSTQELKEMYEDLTQKLRDFNFKLASGQLKDVREVRKTKKTIARILTVLKERKDESKKKIKEK